MSEAGLGVLELGVFDHHGHRVPARFHIEDERGEPWTPAPADRDAWRAAGNQRPVILYSDMRECLGRWTREASCSHLAFGEAGIRLRPGRYTVYVQRGFEFAPQNRVVEVAAGRVTHAEFRLNRVLALPTEGWYGGDIHVHIGRRFAEDNELWTRVLMAEDLHAINTMSFKHGQPEPEMDQYAYGEAGEHQHSHYAISPGTEFRDNELYGHITLAGLQERLDPVSVGPSLGLCENYPLYSMVFEEVRRQGGLGGWAHGGISGPLGGTNNYESLPIEAAMGLVSFVEVVQFRNFLGHATWYGLLNAGLRIAAAGGSDFPFGIWLAPWHPSIGSDRTYARVDGEFTYRKWLDAVGRGQTYASSGPSLRLSVNGAGPGDVVNWEGDRQRVVIRAEARCVLPLECLEIVVNGALVRRIAASGDRLSIEYEEAFDLDRSSWFAARCRGQVAPAVFGGQFPWDLMAHTSPIYLLRGGRPVLVEQDITRLADMVRLIRFSYVRQGKFDVESHREHMLSNCAQALRYYEGLLKTT
ncbi:MAG TPA: CehA/McbA family metallohydrolase [Candidatus Sumerlaeota bacterium]|nr:CehA/McbA family metallohydrolase [Candidatus Sumerlaeota bacterium]